MIITAKVEHVDIAASLAMMLFPNHQFEKIKGEMKEMIQNKEAIIALYLQNGEPVAFAQCQLRYDYVEGTESSPVGYLEGIYVDTDCRKKGIAKELLTYCQKWAKENGCSEFASDCEIDNTVSYNFHKAVGFTEANRIVCFSKRL